MALQSPPIQVAYSLARLRRYDCKGTTVAISSSSCSKLGRESHGLQSADDDVAPGASIAVIAGKVSFTNH